MDDHMQGNSAMNAKVVFIHIPKCAGTSLRHAVSRSLEEYRPEKHLSVRVETRASVRTAEILNKDVQLVREELLLYFMADPGYRFISGHFSFSELAYQQFSEEWSFITLLRHPVERWLSHFFFNRFKQDSHTRISMELEEFLLTERAKELGSEYVRRLAPGSPESNCGSSSSISEALANLERLTMVGLVEKLDVFSADFEKLFHLKVDLPRMNQSPAPERVQAALRDTGLLQNVEDLCQPDMQIYDAAARRHNLLHCDPAFMP
jgi:hypothetical protein